MSTVEKRSIYFVLTISRTQLKKKKMSSFEGRFLISPPGYIQAIYCAKTLYAIHLNNQIKTRKS